MTPLENLQAARDWLADPSRWNKDCFGVDVDGEPLREDELSQFDVSTTCALGAIRLHDPDEQFNLQPDAGFHVDSGRPTAYLMRALIELYGSSLELPWVLRGYDEFPNFPHVPSFNDDPSTTHEMILEMYDRAIKLSEADAA